MAIQDYTMGFGVAKIINRTATSTLIKNQGPGAIFVADYSGSASDGGTDTPNYGIGYPLNPGETVTISGGKAQLNIPGATSYGSVLPIIWVVFS
jgi:hypothetical protein